MFTPFLVVWLLFFGVDFIYDDSTLISYRILSSEPVEAPPYPPVGGGGAHVGLSGLMLRDIALLLVNRPK